MSGVFATHPDGFPFLVQNERERYESQSEKSQCRARPVHAKVMEHGSRKEREPCAERRSHQVVSSQDRSGVFGVRMRLIGEDAVKYDTAADAEQSCRECRDNPVD